VPRIHTLRSPFFNNTVVKVAVETPDRAEMILASSVIGVSPYLVDCLFSRCAVEEKAAACGPPI